MSVDSISTLLRRARRKPIFDRTTLTAVDFDREKIEALLPHRGAMLLLDHLLAVSVDGEIHAQRTIAMDDPVFDGHFPDDPVYPGALQMEAMGQTTLCLHHFVSTRSVEIDDEVSPRSLRLLRVIEATFLGAVRPGDRVDILGTVVEDNGYTFTTIGQMFCGDEIVSVAAFEAMILEEGEEFQ